MKRRRLTLEPPSKSTVVVAFRHCEFLGEPVPYLAFRSLGNAKTFMDANPHMGLITMQMSAADFALKLAELDLKAATLFAKWQLFHIEAGAR